MLPPMMGSLSRQMAQGVVAGLAGLAGRTGRLDGAQVRSPVRHSPNRHSRAQLCPALPLL